MPNSKNWLACFEKRGPWTNLAPLPRLEKVETGHDVLATLVKPVLAVSSIVYANNRGMGTEGRPQ
jgi:hypothetical protein